MIVTRNVDLSIGSVLGLSAYVTGVLFVHHPHVSIVVVFLVAIAIGAFWGVVNGAIVTLVRVPSLVVTLGTLYMIRGLDGTWAGGNQVDAFSLPDRFNMIGYGDFLGVPYLGIIAIVAVAIATYAMRTFRTAATSTRSGRTPTPPVSPGSPSGSRVFLAFVLSGAIAGLAGVFWLSFFGSVDAIAGAGYEFQVIAAVVVGGVAIFGGSGTVLGAALGALLLNTIDSALVVVNVSSFWSMALAGALLLAAIAFDRLVRCGSHLRCAHEGARVAESPSQPGDEATGGPPPRRSFGGSSAGRALVCAARATIAFGAQRLAELPRNPSNVFYICLNVGEVAIMALPLTLIVITGEIDLSVASMLGLTGVVMAELFAHGWSIWPAMAAALARRRGRGRVQRRARDARRPAVARGHDRHADALPRDRAGDPADDTIGGFPAVAHERSASFRFPARRSRTRSRSSPCSPSSSAIVLHATPARPRDLRDRRRQGGGVLRRDPRQADQVLALRRSRGCCAGSPASSGRFGLHRPATTPASGLELYVVTIVLLGGVSIFGGRGTILGVVLAVAVLGTLRDCVDARPRRPPGPEHRRRRPPDRERHRAEPRRHLPSRPDAGSQQGRRRRQRAAPSAEARSVHVRPRVGVFGIGLAAYWPQFEGLRERLEGYQRGLEARLGELGADVVSAGLVDTPEGARRRARRLPPAGSSS